MKMFKKNKTERQKGELGWILSYYRNLVIFMEMKKKKKHLYWIIHKIGKNEILTLDPWLGTANVPDLSRLLSTFFFVIFHVGGRVSLAPKIGKWEDSNY